MSANARLLVEVGASLGIFREDMGKAAAVAEANAKKIQSSFDTASANIASASKRIVGLIGVPLGVSAIIGALTSIRDKVIDDDKSFAQLATTLKATGYAAGLTADQLEGIGEKLKASSTFDDTDIRKAETALLRFRSVQGDVFKDALTTSATLAKALGMSLPDAATMLGKALSSQGTAGMKGLKDAGVFLSEQLIDTAARMDEAGDRAGAMKLKLDEVHKSLGLGGASGQSLGGDINKLSRAWDDLQKTFGREVFGNESRSAKYLTESFEGLTFAVQNFGKAYDKISDLLTVGGLFKAIAGAAFGVKFKPPEKDRADETKAANEESAKFLEGAKTRAGAEQQLQNQVDEAAYVATKEHLKKMGSAGTIFYAGESQAQRAAIELRRDQMASGYARGEVTLEQFYAIEKRLSAETLDAVTQDINKQIEAQEKIQHARIPGTELPLFDRSERADAFAKETALVNQANAARQTFFLHDQQINEKQTVAIEKLGDEYGDLAARIAEAAGSSATSAAIGFEKSTRGFRRQLESLGDTKGLADLSGQGQQTIQLAQLGDETRKYQNVVEGLGIAQGKVDLIAQTGALSEIDLMNRKAEIAAAFVPQLKAQADAYELVARAMEKGILKDEALSKVAAMRLQIDQLAVAGSALKNKFDSIFTDNLTKFFDDITTHTKTVGQAFKDMGKSIGESVLHMVNEQLAKQLYSALFGSSGATGGTSPGGLLAGLLGGGGGGAGLANSVLGGSRMSPGGGGGANFGALGSGISGLFGGGGAAAGGGAGWGDVWNYMQGNISGVQFANISGGGAGAAVIDPESFVAAFGYAGGTNFAPGGLAWVGERGKELVNLPRGAQVIPHDVSMARAKSGGRSTTIVQNITNMPGLSRASASQQNNDAARMAQQARVRLG